MNFSKKNHELKKNNRNLVSKTIKTTIIALVTIIFFASCSSDDTPIVQTPSVTYNETTIDATFFQEGSSSAPTVNWNGNQGSFSLVNTIEGLTINTTTGVLNWSKLLPLETHNIQVIAANSAGQTIINITINTLLQGIFTDATGILNDYDEYEFYIDNTMSIRFITVIGSIPDITSMATGTYTINNNTILADIIFDSGQDYLLNGTLVQSASEASFTGTLYSDTFGSASFEAIMN